MLEAINAVTKKEPVDQIEVEDFLMFLLSLEEEEYQVQASELRELEYFQCQLVICRIESCLLASKFDFSTQLSDHF